MARSRKPSVWIEPPLHRPAPHGRRVRREVDGRRLPSIPVGKNKAYAREVRDRESEALWRGQLRIADPRAPLLTLRDYTASYVDHLRSTTKAARTIYLAGWALGLLAEYVGAETPIMQIDRPRLEGYRAWLLARRWRRGPKGTYRATSPNGARLALRTARAAFRKAYHDELIPRDPFLGLELPGEVSVANPPSDDTIARIWAHLPPRTQRALALAALFGLRRSELYFDKTALIAPTVPSAPWILRVQKAKTRRGRVEYKEIAVPPEAWRWLEPLPDTGPVVTVSPYLLSSDLIKARTAAGVGRVRPHDFRHRWASEFMSEIRDEYSVMQSGGWVSRSAVARYQHVTEDRRRANAVVGKRIALPSVPPILPQKGEGGDDEKYGSPSETSS